MPLVTCNQRGLHRRLFSYTYRMLQDCNGKADVS